LKLLLDEQYSPEIAERLRDDGYDVTAVKGSPELEGIGDEPLLRSAAGQGRALLTNNVSDFAPMATEWAARGDEHLGLIFTSDESMPRARNTIGLYIKKLSELLDKHPGHDAFRGRVAWLS
jgi:predicted nuclease of predicted toxin-antitoxin system